MARIVISAERTVGAPADAVYRYVADMREHHLHFLPPAFSDFRAESGGVGAGTITRFKVTAVGGSRPYRRRGGEPGTGQGLDSPQHTHTPPHTPPVCPPGRREPAPRPH